MITGFTTIFVFPAGIVNFNFLPSISPATILAPLTFVPTSHLKSLEGNSATKFVPAAPFTSKAANSCPVPLATFLEDSTTFVNVPSVVVNFAYTFSTFPRPIPDKS